MQNSARNDAVKNWTGDDVLSLLSYISPDCDYNDWIRVGMALYQKGFSLTYWDIWSRGGEKYDAKVMQQKWKSFSRGSSNGITFGTLVHMAQQNGWNAETSENAPKFHDSIETKELEAQRIKQREEALAKVERINTKMGNSSATEYTKRKHVEVHHPAKAIDGTLFIPLFCADNIVNYQMIFADGTKRFLKGGQTVGCYCVLDCDGSYERENIADADTIFIAEGYATAASLFYWLGVPTVIAFSASNLVAVCVDLRRKYPTKRLIVCGDSGGDGVKYGKEAALFSGAELKTCPPLQHGSDYNDAYSQLHPDEIRAHIFGGDYA